MGRLEARWYLFGAQAVALHGAQRTTQDVDVTVLTDEPTAVLVEALRQERLVTMFDDAAFIEQTRVIPCQHVPSGWKVDVVLGGPGLEELVSLESEPHRVGALRVPVVRLEHLLVLKTLAGRPQDLADIARLLAARPEANLEVVRALLRELGDALADSELVDRFEALVPPRGRRPTRA
ncbi:MAG: nucleotidyltransferase [Myxococcaceae bacterium]|nr:nucleotidyltransferase [Myxococcaceae bacterium]